MEAKIRNGGTHYDVAFPSEYTVQKLKKAKLLETLNHDKIPNIRNLDNDYMNLSYDPKQSIFNSIFLWNRRHFI